MLLQNFTHIVAEAVCRLAELPGAPDSRFRLFRKATSIGTLSPSSCQTRFKSAYHMGKDPVLMALVTVRAAAARLGIGYSTLKQWIYQDASAPRKPLAGTIGLPRPKSNVFLYSTLPTLSRTVGRRAQPD